MNTGFELRSDAMAATMKGRRTLAEQSRSFRRAGREAKIPTDIERQHRGAKAPALEHMYMLTRNKGGGRVSPRFLIKTVFISAGDAEGVQFGLTKPDI